MNLPRLKKRILSLIPVAALAALSGCCCLPCGPCGFGGCLPYEASCLPAPSSFAADFCSPDCGIPSYAVPGCESPCDIMPGCEMPLAGGCECCGPVMSASACDGCGVGAPCKPFPLLSKLFCGWWLPRCPPYMVDPYQPSYYCDHAYEASPAVYEQPVYHNGPVYHGTVEQPAHFQAPMPAPTETVVPAPAPTPAEPSASLPRDWQPSGVRQVQHRTVSAPPQMRRAPVQHQMSVQRQTSAQPPMSAELRRQHAAWQPPPRW